MLLHLSYMGPFLLAGIFVLALAAWVWPRRHVPFVRVFLAFCAAQAYWSFSEGLLYLGLDVDTNLIITFFQYLGVVVTLPLVFILTCTTVGLERLVAGPRALLLSLIPALTLLAVWTTPEHRLFYRDWYEVDTGPIPMLGLEHGPLFWCWIAYSYSLLLATAAVLVYRLWRPAGSRRGQSAVLLVSLSVTALANLIYLTGNSPVRNMDISSMTFIVVAVAFAWAILRFEFLDLVPMAKAQIFDNLLDAIMVLDSKQRLIAANPAAERLIGHSFASVYGAPIKSLFPRWPGLPADHGSQWLSEMPLESPERWLELRFSVLLDSEQRQAGLLTVCHDVTERKDLEQKLVKLANIDSLTGAFNRRQFLELAEAEVDRCRRYGQALSLLMLDLDHFKRINDNFGHAAGDEVLKAVAATCRSSLRASDPFGRLGGEEFVALLLNTDLSEARQVGEKLRARIEALEHPIGSRSEKVTTSVGVAELKSGESVTGMLARADAALYRAKHTGRNGIIALE